MEMLLTRNFVFSLGKEGQQSTGLSDLGDEQNSALADSHLLMMERLGILFTR